MIKRNFVMLLVLLVLVTNLTLTANAATNEVTFEGGVFTISNPTSEEYEIDCELIWYDSDGNQLYSTKVTNITIRSFEYVIVNPEEFYKSQKTGTVTCDIVNEKPEELNDMATKLTFWSTALFIVGAVVISLANAIKSIQKKSIRTTIGIIGIILILVGLCGVVFGLTMLFT